MAICEECVDLAHDAILPAMSKPERAAGGQVSLDVFAEAELTGQDD